jgi:hypothetical protein
LASSTNRKGNKEKKVFRLLLAIGYKNSKCAFKFWAIEKGGRVEMRGLDAYILLTREGSVLRVVRVNNTPLC